MRGAQTVEHVVHIRRFSHRAVKVRRQTFDSVFDCGLTHAHQALVIPSGVIAAEFDLHAFQAVAPNPVREQHGIAVVRLLAGQLGWVERIESADQVPGAHFVPAPGEEKFLWKPAVEIH